MSEIQRRRDIEGERGVNRMGLIVATRSCDGKKVYVNPQNVCAIYPYYRKETTVIQLVGAEENYLEVTESVAVIASMFETKLTKE